MSAEFVDTNILVYGNHAGGGVKREIASALLARLVETGTGAVSTQVLSEFLSVCSKGRIEPAVAESVVNELRMWTLHRPEHSDLIAAWRLHQRYQVSWWDALIIQSAERLGCNILWTEDLSHGQQYGSVTVRNPFLD